MTSMRRERSQGETEKKGKERDICQCGEGTGFRCIPFHQRLDQQERVYVNEKEKIIYKYGSVMRKKYLNFISKNFIHLQFQYYSNVK